MNENIFFLIRLGTYFGPRFDHTREFCFATLDLELCNLQWPNDHILLTILRLVV